MSLCAVCLSVSVCVYVYMYAVDEEISNMRRELDKYGIQMPAFSKIGGMLASEVSDTGIYIHRHADRHTVRHAHRQTDRQMLSVILSCSVFPSHCVCNSVTLSDSVTCLFCCYVYLIFIVKNYKF